MFNDSSNRISETQNNKTNIINETNNLIKNLKYEIQLSNNRKYIINSDLSELTFINKKEIIYMTNVMAVFIDKNNIALKIEAKKATFDSSTNNTKFRDNVNINYLDNYIFAEKVDLNFIENIILIHGNTLYKSPKGEVNTDNIKIDLVNNNIFMYMNDSKKKMFAYNIKINNNGWWSNATRSLRRARRLSYRRPQSNFLSGCLQETHQLRDGEH